MIGIKKHWIDKTEQIFFSDLEKTILDGLKMPEYWVGITKVAKGFWIKRDDIDVTRELFSPPISYQAWLKKKVAKNLLQLTINSPIMSLKHTCFGDNIYL